MLVAMTVEGFIAKWASSEAAERAHKDSFLNELCDVIGVPRPDQLTGDPAQDRYVFEADATLVHDGKKNSVGKMDLYKRGCFVLEAKQGSNEGAKKLGSARRGTAGWTIMMQKAYGQAIGYAKVVDAPPPFLVVCDIGHCFDLYACFDGSSVWKPFPDALHNRVFFSTLTDPAVRDLLKGIWTAPMALDPSLRAAKVTREVAVHLAELARMFEAKYKPEDVAGFLMRCIFTMFAEDAGMFGLDKKKLPRKLFTEALRDDWLDDPKRFQPEVENLWRVMNEGGYFGIAKLLKFNGGLFADARALPITDRKVLDRLLEAATCDWSKVEPAIFGTLLERALDPKERHRLGAHYTPRAYVERLVRPTLEAPLRAKWEAVRAEALKRVDEVVSAPVPGEDAAATAAGKKKRAKKVLPNTVHGRTQVVKEARVLVKAFHQELCKVRVLDPACGTGNFLYVALDAMKRLESEVLALDAQLAASVGIPVDAAFEWGATVTPAQFLGIEKKLWAKEIAELVLWIGFLQWFQRTRQNDDGSVRWEEPVLRNLHNIECRDAVLAWDQELPVLDEKGKPVTRWDGESMKKSPVTGEDVPDETRRVLVTKLVNPRRAKWPEADYVVGNPPFLGKLHVLSQFGLGYTTGLRETYAGDVPDSADFVMYWWFRAGELTRASKVARFGFITTNSISQTFNRRVIEAALNADPSLSITFAIPDHPWVDTVDGAAVRIAMTVGVRGSVTGALNRVVEETMQSDGSATPSFSVEQGVIHANLRIGANVTVAASLQSNQDIAGTGLILGNRGFVLDSIEAEALRSTSPEADSMIAPLWNGKDITERPRGAFVIDTNGWKQDALQARAPAVWQHLRKTVYPERQTNRDPRVKANWWLFRRSNEQIRGAIAGLSRYIATVETAKHRVFVWMKGHFKPEHKLVVFGSDDASVLGMLSSRIHVVWALSTGGHLGVGNDPVYSKTKCFDPFPFPAATPDQAARIRELAESLDAHRKARQAAHPTLTMTGMYNVLAKLRAGEALTPKDQEIHTQGLVSVLKQLHDDLDAAVFAAYGWDPALTDEEILAKVVALNAERAEEESRGVIRWLRPEFQNPGGAKAATQETMDLGDEPDEGAAVASAVKPIGPWPKKTSEQFAAVRDLLATRSSAWSATQVTDAFKGASEDDVAEMMATLVVSGQAVAFQTPEGTRWQRAG